MNYNQTFLAFLNEAQFTSQILGIGATRIRKANYGAKGLYYESFTCLSTGLERIGKMCLLLDSYISSNGGFPKASSLKKSFGHDILLLYRKSQEIAERRSIEFDFLQNLDDGIHQNILNILSDFAQFDRYSNINAIAGSSRANDAMQRWFIEVDDELFSRHVPEKTKEKIQQNAEIIHQLTHSFMHVHFISEEGNSIDNVQEASFRSGKQEAISKYRQLYVLQIIRYWAELISTLGDIAMEFGRFDIPYFDEIFGQFINPDAYFKTRKIWDEID